MDIRFFSLRRVLIFAAVALVSVSVEAQPPATNAWQPIIFSAPDNAQISSNLILQPSSSSFENRLQLFQDSSPVAAFGNAPLPAGPAPMLRRFQKPDDSRQWEFMTPAEILGVSPAQIIQGQGRDTNSDLGSLTPMERYLEGKNAFAHSQTNYSSYQQQNPWAGGDQQTNNSSAILFSGFGTMQQSNVSGPFLGNASDNLFGNPNADSGWSKIFGSPASPTESNPTQSQPEMSQFMQLLNPNPTPAMAAMTAPDETPFKSPTSLPGPDSTAPLANSIGASFAPLNSGISQPAGLAPLPSLAQPSVTQPLAPPAWAPQPPPWLSSTPQPFAVPQRKF